MLLLWSYDKNAKKIREKQCIYVSKDTPGFKYNQVSHEHAIPSSYIR